MPYFMLVFSPLFLSYSWFALIVISVPISQSVRECRNVTVGDLGTR